MKSTRYRVILLTFVILSAVGLAAYSTNKETIADRVISYTADLQEADIIFYWKDEKGNLFQNIGGLERYIEAKGQKLLFAMNGGMFKPDGSPQGLFIQEGKLITPLDTASGNGNFYLKPNGVFYITESNKAVVCPTENFIYTKDISYATQSGPMLVIEGEIHPDFKEGSKNTHIRNGVGILPDGKVIFAISKTRVNFYDFASYFQSMGCKNALYLDGYVSRAYVPEKNWVQTDGNFGVIIGITK